MNYETCTVNNICQKPDSRLVSQVTLGSKAESMELRSFHWVIISASSMILLGSCASVKPCGEPYTETQEFFQSKKFKEAFHERDSLCERTADLEGILASTEKDLASTKKDLEASRDQVKKLNDDLSESKKKFDDLQRSSGAQVAGLSSDLQAKQRELEAKEELLKNREERLKMLEEIVKKQDELMKTLSDRVKDALMGFAADELSVEMRDGKVYVSMSDKLLFKSGSDAVEPKGIEALNKIADVLKKNADISMAIEGHTDSIPIKTNRFKDNWDLSTARATSVVRILTGNGVEPDRLIASGNGEFSPKATNSTKEGRAINRRTELVLSPKLNELLELLGQYSGR
jgi:chemotaxis protein MotB